MVVRRVGLVLLLATAACGDKGSDDDLPDDTDADGATDTGEGEGGGGATTPQSLTVTLTDPAGAPRAGVSIKFCNLAGCRYGDTTAEGIASFSNVELVPYSLEPVPPADSGLATPYIPITFAPDETKVLTIVMPPLDASMPLAAPTELEVDGLLVTVGADDLVPNDAFSEPATELAGVQVDAAAWPPIGLPGTVLAVWYLEPFDYGAPAGLPTRFDNTFGLADGETAHVWVGSYSAFDWIDGGVVTAEGAYLTGASLPLLSTVVLVRE